MKRLVQKPPITNEGRLRRAACFMLLGLGIEAITLQWRHPLSIYVFVAGWGVCGLLGVGSFLRALISPSAKRGSWAPPHAVEELEEEPAQAANG
jgi:hypothetical protein